MSPSYGSKSLQSKHQLGEQLSTLATFLEAWKSIINFATTKNTADSPSPKSLNLNEEGYFLGQFIINP